MFFTDIYIYILSTGRLTAGLAFFGSAAKLFIAMRETGDDIMLVGGSGIAAGLNFILFFQTLVYANSNVKQAEQKKKQ